LQDPLYGLYQWKKLTQRPNVVLDSLSFSWFWNSGGRTRGVGVNLRAIARC